jgi:hypothetical protein
MRRNSGLIGEQRNPSKESAAGIFDTFDAYNARKNDEWPIVASSIEFLSANQSSINEGASVTFSITTSANFITGTIFYDIEQVTGLILASDFVQPLTGQVQINNNQGSLILTAAEDTTTDGQESFRVNFRFVQNGSISATSDTIVINDTSLGGAADWTSNIITQTGTNGTTSTNICNIYYRRSIMMWVYTASEMQAAFGKSSATISGLRFFVNGQPQYQPLPDYAIGMKNGTFTGSPGGAGYTVVKNPSNERFTTNQNKVFDPLDTTFNWTGGDLAIIFAWGQCPVTYSATGQSGIGSGTMYYSWTDGAGAYVINVTTPTSTRSWRPVVQLYG